MVPGTGQADTPFSSGRLTSLPHAHHAVAGFHRKAPEPSCPSLGVRAVGGEKLGFTPRTWTWLQGGLEGLRKGLKDLKLWARRPSGRLPSMSAGAPASHRCPPLWNRAGVLQMLPKLPASPRHRCSGCWGDHALCWPQLPLQPATLSLPPSHSLSSFALSLFLAVPLEEPEALTLSLCFQDFRKYEEGFDPYSMVRNDSPPLGSKPRSRGPGVMVYLVVMPSGL